VQDVMRRARRKARPDRTKSMEAFTEEFIPEMGLVDYFVKG
jgi:hypothetical protein